MGRLTLNILLSFAQFEREVIGERIRDKFAASRRKGMWMGGTPPLGYDVRDRKLVVNEKEAELVRLDLPSASCGLGSATKLAQELRRAGHTTKSWTTQDGKHRPGKPIDKGAIYKILNNRTYLGEAVHKGTHVSRGARRRSSIARPGTRCRPSSPRIPSPAASKPRADAGAAEGVDLRARRSSMTPSHTRKAGSLYRYYVSYRRHPTGLLGMPGAQRAGRGGRGSGRGAGAAPAAHARDHRADMGGGEDRRGCRSAR